MALLYKLFLRQENLIQLVFWQCKDGHMKQPHIVADAAFGSIEMLEKITTWGGSATLSCPQQLRLGDRNHYLIICHHLIGVQLNCNLPISVCGQY